MYKSRRRFFTALACRIAKRGEIMSMSKKIKSMKEFIDKKRLFNFLILICGICLIIIFSFVMKEKGRRLGKTAGELAGKLSGSLEGITKGTKEGAQKGKEDGLSAKDTQSDIGNKIHEIGTLEVLSASVVMHDLLEISDKYKTILAFYGDVTFVVDLYDADITLNEKSIEVLLSEPTAALRINDKKSEQLASNMKHSWSGSDEDGYTAAMNSIKELTLNAEQTISNYDILMNSAKDSAVKLVSFLIQSATQKEVVVHVRFK